MKIENQKVRLALLTTAVLALVLLVIRQYRPDKTQMSITPVSAPHSGSWVDTHGAVPGNPEKAEEQLKLLCRIYNTYLSNHREEYLAKAKKGFEPLGLSVIRDMSQHREEYREFQGINFMEAMKNPDVEYSDLPPALRSSENKFIYGENSYRPDGSPIGSSKLPGTRDVLAQTNIYFHENSNAGTEWTKTTINPVGFYLVLWDDCTVERIPYYDTLIATGTHEKGTFHTCFRGQAGVPADALSYDEQNAKYLHSKKPIRGKTGIVGLNLNGDEILK